MLQEMKKSFSQLACGLQFLIARSIFFTVKEAEKWSFKSKIRKPKISSFEFTRNFRRCSKNSIEKQDGRFVAMVTKALQTLNLKFDQVMFSSLVLAWERNFEVTFGIFSVLVFQISVLESYLDIYLF